MRIIKFRIWNGFTMKYPMESKLFENCEWKMNYSKEYDIKGNRIRSIVQKSSVTQFTGMKDKTGADIYEGDILSTPNKGKGIVEWFECGFVLKLQNETVWTNLLFNVIGHYNIEGNIYENPELQN